MTANSSGPVALATCAAVAGREKDDLQVIQTLRQRGVDAVHVCWDDPAVDWATFGLVVVRSTWDYARRRAQFLNWAEKLPRVLNSADLLRWNTDKHYLQELARAGLPVIPTSFLEPGDRWAPPTTPFVIKPAISCSAQDTASYRLDDWTAASLHVRRLHEEGRTAMLQPLLPEVGQEGEINLVFLAGTFSHAIRRWTVPRDKGSAQDGSLDIEAHAATPAELALAEAALQAVPGGPAKLLYARVDLVSGLQGEWHILEVELTEPALFLQFSQDGADKLAAGIDFRLSADGR